MGEFPMKIGENRTLFWGFSAKKLQSFGDAKIVYWRIDIRSRSKSIDRPISRSIESIESIARIDRFDRSNRSINRSNRLINWIDRISDR